MFTSAGREVETDNWHHGVWQAEKDRLKGHGQWKGYTFVERGPPMTKTQYQEAMKERSTRAASSTAEPHVNQGDLQPQVPAWVEGLTEVEARDEFEKLVQHMRCLGIWSADPNRPDEPSRPHQDLHGRQTDLHGGQGELRGYRRGNATQRGVDALRKNSTTDDEFELLGP